MKSYILIVDTAHPVARVILVDDEKTMAIREWPNTPKVGTDLLASIEEVLQEANIEKTSITRIAVHSGPGSYGLVRTGIVTGTLLAQAIGAQLVEAQGETVDEIVENVRDATPVTSTKPKYNT